jgi:hypothetical protein
MTTVDPTVIKRGDTADLTFDLGLDLSVYDDAQVIIGWPGDDPIVDRAGVIDGETVTITLTAEETATGGFYAMEGEMTPGPHTSPSTGNAFLEIRPDLG